MTHCCHRWRCLNGDQSTVNGGGGGSGGEASSGGLFVSLAIGGGGAGGGDGGDVDVVLSNTDASQPSTIRTTGDFSSWRAGSVHWGWWAVMGGGAISAAAGFGGAASLSIVEQGAQGAQAAWFDSAAPTPRRFRPVVTTAQAFWRSQWAVAAAVAATRFQWRSPAALLVPSPCRWRRRIRWHAVAREARLKSGFSTATVIRNQRVFLAPIQTAGDRSTGAVFQSVGGGGGNGGLAVAASGSGSLVFSGNVSIGVGGGQRERAVMGAWFGYSQAQASPLRASRRLGLIAQSVGGGGGNGGGTVAGRHCCIKRRFSQPQRWPRGVQAGSLVLGGTVVFSR